MSKVLIFPVILAGIIGISLLMTGGNAEPLATPKESLSKISSSSSKSCSADTFNFKATAHYALDEGDQSPSSLPEIDINFLRRQLDPLSDNIIPVLYSFDQGDSQLPVIAVSHDGFSDEYYLPKELSLTEASLLINGISYLPLPDQIPSIGGEVINSNLNMRSFGVVESKTKDHLRIQTKQIHSTQPDKVKINLSKGTIKASLGKSGKTISKADVEMNYSIAFGSSIMNVSNQYQYYNNGVVNTSNCITSLDSLIQMYQLQKIDITAAAEKLEGETSKNRVFLSLEEYLAKLEKALLLLGEAKEKALNQLFTNLNDYLKANPNEIEVLLKRLENSLENKSKRDEQLFLSDLIFNNSTEQGQSASLVLLETFRNENLELFQRGLSIQNLVKEPIYEMAQYLQNVALDEGLDHSSKNLALLAFGSVASKVERQQENKPFLSSLKKEFKNRQKDILEQAKVIDALGNYDSEESLDFVVQLIDSQDEKISERAIQAVGRISGDTAEIVLIETIRAESTPQRLKMLALEELQRRIIQPNDERSFQSRLLRSYLEQRPAINNSKEVAQGFLDTIIRRGRYTSEDQVNLFISNLEHQLSGVGGLTEYEQEFFNKLKSQQ